MSFYTPSDYTAGKTLSAAQVNRDFYQDVLWLYAHYPQRAQLHHLHSTVVSGAAITGTVDTSQPYMVYFYQSPGAINDQFTQTVRLAAGLYQVKFIGEQHASAGIFDVDIDGASIGDGFDAYSAATNRNVDLLGGNGYVEITRSGVFTLTVTVYSQNGGSAGYELRITTIDFLPAGGEL